MYFDYLWQMLEPLGVYRGEGYHLGELKALGAGLDEAQGMLDVYLREIHPGTALNTGLEQAEQLFPMLVANSTSERRAALGVLFATGPQGSSKMGLEETLAACGIPVTIRETDTKYHCLVILQDDLVITKDPIYLFWVIDSIMPCHMVTEVLVSYLDLRTNTNVSERMALSEVRKRTQGEWEARLGAVE